MIAIPIVMMSCFSRTVMVTITITITISTSHRITTAFLHSIAISISIIPSIFRFDIVSIFLDQFAKTRIGGKRCRRATITITIATTITTTTVTATVTVTATLAIISKVISAFCSSFLTGTHLFFFFLCHFGHALIDYEWWSPSGSKAITVAVAIALAVTIALAFLSSTRVFTLGIRSISEKCSTRIHNFGLTSLSLTLLLLFPICICTRIRVGFFFFGFIPRISGISSSSGSSSSF
mmetsp:Transcript_8234/g.12324  ORF Transcript_8234/g.12324 Transcript_8234/m.12324 type:complete len:236 (+) Transcript_8234:750-1457(+)